MDGKPTPSPIPMHPRHSSRLPAEAGVSMVKHDHAATPQKSVAPPPKRCESQPPGSWVRMYP